MTHQARRHDRLENENQKESDPAASHQREIRLTLSLEEHTLLLDVLDELQLAKRLLEVPAGRELTGKLKQALIHRTSQKKTDNRSTSIVCSADASSHRHPERLELKPTSSRILEYLVHHRECWIRPETLRAEVLSTHYSPGASNLRWHILQLRNGLADAQWQIHTDRNLGVMFSTSICGRPHCYRRSAKPAGPSRRSQHS